MKEGCNENEMMVALGGALGRRVLHLKEMSLVKFEQTLSFLTQADAAERPHSAASVTEHPFGHWLSPSSIKQGYETSSKYKVSLVYGF